jgi:hypothetical protein
MPSPMGATLSLRMSKGPGAEAIDIQRTQVQSLPKSAPGLAFEELEISAAAAGNYRSFSPKNASVRSSATFALSAS